MNNVESGSLGPFYYSVHQEGAGETVKIAFSTAVIPDDIHIQYLQDTSGV
jgi:hypothetical protein